MGAEPALYRKVADDIRVTTALADGDSLRYYPAYELPGRSRLAPQHPVAERARAQLLLAQRADGSLTIGDTHCYDEPFDFDVDSGAGLLAHLP